MPVVPHAADRGVRHVRRGIEAVRDRLEVHAAHAPQRLHLERAEGPGEVGVAAPHGLRPGARRQRQLAGDQGTVLDRIAQLVGRHADVIGLLRERERDAVAVQQRATARREHDPLGALRLRLLRPAPPLQQLHLGRARDQERECRTYGDLDHLEPDGESRHR